MRNMEFENVYQFKITLKGIRPPIWRRIQVPDTYTFWDLHVAIQDAMGWYDMHLHSFDIKDSKTGQTFEISTPEEEEEEGESPIILFLGRLKILRERNQKIADWFSPENKTANYTYDFGDGWEHSVRFEKVLLKEEGVTYPKCVTGKRACPPEDSGGPWGYQQILDVLKDPKHEEYADIVEWVGYEFDPEEFSCADVGFDDPERRWREFSDMVS